MTDYTNSFNQSAGTITAANSAASGTAFVSCVSNGVTLAYSTVWKAYGTASMRVSGGSTTSATGYVGWSLGGNQQVVTTRFYLYMTALPTTDTYIAVPVNSTTTLGGIKATTSGKMAIKSPSGTIYTGSAVLTINTKYRVEATFTIGTTSSNGKLLLKVFAGDSTTALDTISPAAINTGTTPITAIRFGKVLDTAAMDTFYIDELAVRTSATLFGPSGTALPTVSLNSSVTGTAATLTPVVSTYDNVAPAYAWSQTAGPTVSLTAGATSQTLSGLAAGTYTFSLTVTDDVSHTATDTETFTIASSTPPPSGSTIPNASALLYPDVFVISALGSTAAVGGALSYTITPSTGLTALGPGVWAGLRSSAATSYTVQVSEVGASAPSSVTVVVPSDDTTSNGTGIIIEVATDDAALGGIFM